MVFLDERKKAILKAIIDDYINTAEPIGSRTVARRHELGLSSATIRNEMADLEDMGYLLQPHTSAGRIPSVKGYRLYVDELMNVEELSREEIEYIHESLESNISEIRQLLKQASVIMSKVTKYTSVAVTPYMREIKIKAVQVIPIDSKKALAIIVTSAGMVKNTIVQLPRPVDLDFINRVSNLINDKLSGTTIDKVDESKFQSIELEMWQDRDIVGALLAGVEETLKDMDNVEIYLDGTSNIFNFPEFRDIIKAREFFNILDAKDILRKILIQNKTGEKSGVEIRIGTENEIEEIKDYSLVTATYSLDDVLIGSVGIIGPTRMAYPKVISSVNYIRKKINNDLRNFVSDLNND